MSPRGPPPKKKRKRKRKRKKKEEKKRKQNKIKIKKGALRIDRIHVKRNKKVILFHDW